MSADEAVTVAAVAAFLDRGPDRSGSGHRDHALAELLYATGLPLERLVRLRVGAVDLVERTV